MEEMLTALQDETGGTAFILATVEAVAEGGVKLQIDGQDKAGEKLYPCNAGALFRPGDRVKLTPDSGTYIVDFPMGKPGERYPIPKGGSEGQLLAKAGANDFTLKWLDAPDCGENYIPKGGTAGQVLTKKNSYDYELQWSNLPENPLPTGGSDGQVRMKSGKRDPHGGAEHGRASGTRQLWERRPGEQFQNFRRSILQRNDQAGAGLRKQHTARRQQRNAGFLRDDTNGKKDGSEHGHSGSADHGAEELRADRIGGTG